jgi:hypothetical protein
MVQTFISHRIAIHSKEGLRTTGASSVAWMHCVKLVARGG